MQQSYLFLFAFGTSIFFAMEHKLSPASQISETRETTLEKQISANTAELARLDRAMNFYAQSAPDFKVTQEQVTSHAQAIEAIKSRIDNQESKEKRKSEKIRVRFADQEEFNAAVQRDINELADTQVTVAEATQKQTEQLEKALSQAKKKQEKTDKMLRSLIIANNEKNREEYEKRKKKYEEKLKQTYLPEIIFWHLPLTAAAGYIAWAYPQNQEVGGFMTAYFGARLLGKIIEASTQETPKPPTLVQLEFDRWTEELVTKYEDFSQ